LDGSLKEAPEAKLAVQETLFRLYADLGLQDQAVVIGRSRVSLARSVYGPDHSEVARALVELAANSGSSSFANDRASILKDAGRILDRNRDSRSRIRALYYLAMGSSTFRTDLAATERFAAKSVELYRKYPPSRDLVSGLNLLGQAQEHRHEYSAAIASLSEAARVANALQGEARAPLPAIYAYLGSAQRNSMDLSGAEKSIRLAVETARTLKGEDHVDVIQTKYRLGVFLSQTSRPVEGLKWLKEAVEDAVRTQGANESFHTPMVWEGYGVHLVRYGRIEDGLVPITQCLDVLRRVNQSGTYGFAGTLLWKARAETDLGHYQQADATLAEVSAIRARLDSPPPDYRSDMAIVSAGFQMATGKAEEAAKALAEYPLDPGVQGILSYDWLDISLARAEASLARNCPQEALEEARGVQKRIEASGLEIYFKRWEAEAMLEEGKALLLFRRPAEALPLLQRAVRLGLEVYDPDRSPRLAGAEIALAMDLVALDRRAEALPLWARAKAIHATHRDLGEQYRKPLRELEAVLRGRH